MITIKNNLNQSLTIGDKSLAADASAKFAQTSEEIERLALAGHVTVIEDAESKTKEETPKEKK